MTERKMALPKAQLAAYERDGYAVVRQVFAEDEVKAWSNETARLWDLQDVGPANPRLQWRDHQEGGQTADRLDPVLDISPTFDRLAHDPRILERLALLLGGRPVPLKAKLISKWPGTAGYSMHQDYPYWDWLNIPADHLVNAFIAIDPATAENGAVEVVPGYHHERLPAPAESPLDTDPAHLDLSCSTLLELAPGDVAVTHSLVPHRSGANRSARSRQQLILTYTLAAYGLGTAEYYAGRARVRAAAG